MNINENNQDNGSEGSFNLPGGYFQRSAGSIMNKIEWEDEHKIYPSLYRLKNDRAFGVPDGYFGGGEARLEIIDCRALLAIPKINSFVTPPSYFEQTEISELSKVMLPEADELTCFETLRSVDKQNSFGVDELYFEVNEKLLNTLLEPQKQARIIDLFFSRSSYVVAALLVMAIGLWLYSIYVRPVQELKDCGTMACVDRADLMKTRNLESLDDDDLLELVNPNALEKKLEDKPSNIKAKTTKDSSLNKQDEEEIMEEI